MASTKEVRKHVEVKKGQQVYILPKRGSFRIIPLSAEADGELQKLMGDVKFDKTARRMAEAFLLKQAK